MLKGIFATLGLSAAMVLMNGVVFADDQESAQERARDQVQEQTQTRTQTQIQEQEQAKKQAKTQTRAQTRAREQIYGSQLMTRRERNEYRNRIRAAKSAEEREQIRMEHHERMQVRAKERGVSIADEPPGRGDGMMAPGGGMAPRAK